MPLKSWGCAETSDETMLEYITRTGHINMLSYPLRIFRFYRDGFRSMTLGKILWKLILIKLLIMFGVLKLFFFPNFLNTQFTTDEQKANYVMEQITQTGKQQN